MWQALQLAQKMGKSVGRGQVLQRSLSPQQVLRFLMQLTYSLPEQRAAMSMSKSTPPSYDELQQAEDRALLFHPLHVWLVLLLFGLSMLFLALSAAFVYTRIQSQLPPIWLPPVFLANTALLLMSSLTMRWANKCYRQDDTERYKLALGLTIVLSLVFLGAQIYGWWSLFQDDVLINSDNSASYLYVISALHFLHVIGGLPFLVVYLWRAHKHMREPVSVLIYFSDPDKRLRLRLLTLYWHFLDALWIYLVLFFYINYWLQ